MVREVAPGVKEVLADGRNVVDKHGDVVPRHDFSRDEYAEPPAEMLRSKAVLHVIDTYEAGQYAKSLASRGSRDKKVQQAGGVNACRKRGLELLLEARSRYIRSQGIEVVNEPALNDPQRDAKQDEFDRGVALWMSFRMEVLENDEARFTKRHELEQKIEQYETLFHL